MIDSPRLDNSWPLELDSIAPCDVREHHAHFEKDGKKGTPESTHASAMQAKLYDKAARPVPTAVKVIAFLLVN